MTSKTTSIDSLSALLSPNLQLQKDLSLRLTLISQLKYQNRVAARMVVSSLRLSRCKRSSTAVGSAATAVGSAATADVFSAFLLRERFLDLAAKRDGGCRASVTETATTCRSNSDTCTGSATTRKRQRRSSPSEKANGNAAREWRRNDLRKWRRRYFIDADSSMPQPNDDAIHHSQWLQESSLSKHLSNHTPLREEVEGTSLQIGTMDGNHPTGPKGKGQNDKGHTGILAVSPMPRDRCPLSVKSSKKSRPGNLHPTMTKAEICAVQAFFDKKFGYPVWSSLPDILLNESSSGGLSHQTAWDCFRYIQKETMLSSNMPRQPSLPSQPWYGEEDAVLLKAIAALGPQFVVVRDNAMDLTARLLCDRSVKQTKTRANMSLVNPNYRSNKPWSDEEERKLVLLVRAYSKCEYPLIKLFVSYDCISLPPSSQNICLVASLTSNYCYYV